MRHVILCIMYFLDRLKKDNISVFSAYAAFFTILAAFPCAMLLLTLIRFTPATKESLIIGLENLMPDTFYPLIQTIINDLYQKTAGTVTFMSITGVTALWSASKGVFGILKGLNAVYHINESRNYIVQRLICIFYTFVFIIILVLTLTVLVFGNTIQSMLTKHIPVFAHITQLLMDFRTLITIVILVIFFMIVYKVFPNRKIKFMQQLPGALFVAVSWIVFSFVFSIYIDNFGNYSYMYGSLTTIVLLMLWLYICMNLVFLGGEINCYLEEYVYKLRKTKTSKVSDKKEKVDTKQVKMENDENA